MKTHRIAFAVSGSIMSIFFLALVNYLTSPGVVWFIHPAFALIQWPVALYFAGSGRIKAYSVATTVLIIAYLAYQNITETPGYPWILYAGFAIVWWPILMYAGRFAGTLAMALIGSFCIIIYYGMLNLLLSPQFPWIIFPAYAVLWWPMSIYFVRTRQWFSFALCASLLSSALFITVNAITSPEEIWAIYPIFAVVWWPLSMYFFVKKPAV
ncbi:hypothetical protein [Paenibacillus sacheonensis]|uniref:Uncharacterized protein n=1 Tax=Paenibacillus sacheonensis TaxID=742054 RepID=A0A7X5BV34_9BACL|nr:hypothetical protein [Paenibacillus sacheonensis]MBM7563447.1 putative membrane protein [Paenibacillus sacheonensis]NBC67998.1 hypothetical protein [Paenibacillus sacheonensis]